VTLRERAAALKANSYALYLASRNPRTPAAVRWLCLAIIAYLLSPIDLIPDFIPVIGYLDDVILLPLAIALLIRMIPDDIWHACKQQAAEELAISSPYTRWVTITIAAIWVVLAACLILLCWRWLNSQ